MVHLPFRKKEEVVSKKDEELLEKKVRKPRKKKDPPPKPWGKLERAVIFTFLVGIPIMSILFFLHSKNAKNGSPISLPAPQIISNIIVTKRDTRDIVKSLSTEIKTLDGTYGIWVQSLDDTFKFGINENDQFEGASLFKLPLMIAYYQKLDRGEIEPNVNYTIRYSDKQSGAGILSNLPAGTNVTYQDIIDAMGKNSDNTAFQVMSNILEPNTEVNEISSIGMTNTDFNNSSTTPFDIGLLFYKLEKGSLISNSSKDKLYKSLENTDFENLIPNGIPNTVKVAHKFAASGGEVNDAGIVWGKNSFIIVIFSQNSSEDEITQEFPKLTKMVYDWSIK